MSGKIPVPRTQTWVHSVWCYLFTTKLPWSISLLRNFAQINNAGNVIDRAVIAQYAMTENTRNKLIFHRIKIYIKAYILTSDFFFFIKGTHILKQT